MLSVKIFMVFLLLQKITPCDNVNEISTSESKFKKGNLSCQDVPWLKKCRCAIDNHNFDGKLYCDENQYLSVLDCFCMTYDTKNKKLQVGACVENCMNITKNKLYHYPTPPQKKALHFINEKVCASRFNRAGRLCGKCRSEFSPLAFSYNLTCVNCTEGNRNLWKYFLVSLTPLTCFYIFILYFKVSITSSHLHGYIIFAQVVAVPAFGRIMTLVISSIPSFNYPIKFLASLFTIWNLDFFRMFSWGICLNMTPLSIRALDYTIALYPFVLSIVSYVLIELHRRNVRIVVYIWRPFRRVFTLFRRNWHIRTSIIDAYATFFQLSCFKILCISFDLLMPTYIYTVGESYYVNDTSIALYYDGTIDFFQSEHLPYAILALSFLFVFTILPIVFLLIYPCHCFQFVLNQCHLNFQVLREFMESIYKCYKDGTEPGTKDCRWFAALDIIFRLAMFLVYSCTHSDLFFPLSVVVIILIVLLLVHVQPHKKSVSHYSKIDVTFYCLLGLCYVSVSASTLASVKARLFTDSFRVISLIISFVPLLYITCLSLHWIFTRARRMCWSSLISQIRAKRRGYQNIEESYPHRMIHPGQYSEDKLNSFAIKSDIQFIVDTNEHTE